MKAGDIIFSRSNGLISRIIRKIDGNSPWSHVSLCLSSKSILEAQYFTKSRITPFYFDDYEIVELDLTDDQRDLLTKLSVDMTGRWYNYRRIFVILFSYIFRRKLSDKWNNPNHMICSTILVYLLIQVGYFNNEKEAERMLDFTPHELYRYLQLKNKNK